MNAEEDAPADREPVADPDDTPSADEPSLTELDKELADSFPASDPPAMP